MFKKIFIAILGCAINFYAFADNSATFTDATKPIMVQKNQKELVITLKSNRTTGYGWFLKSYDNNLLQLAGYKYIAPTGRAVGAPGAEQFVFDVKQDAYKAPQMSKITLTYARPWEMNSGKDTNITWIVA